MAIVAAYAALLVLLVTVLALNVSRNRIESRVSFGDGGSMPLQAAIRAHMNALEQILPLLPLLWFAAWLEQPAWSLHMVGMTLLVSRVLHAIGMLKRNFLFRRLGAMLSYVLGIGMPVWLLVTLALRG